MVVDERYFLEGLNLKKDWAYRELYHHFYASLCRYSDFFIKNVDVAKDIVQECIIHLWDSDSHFSDIKSITTYLYRAVYHGSLNFIRNSQARDRIHSNYWQTEDEKSAVYAALEEEVIARFYAVVSQLPERQRDILLYSLKGNSVKEIAELLSITENTVKTHKKKAYQFVREQLGDMWILAIILFLTRS